MPREPRYRYHATFARSLPEIGRKGLTPNFDRDTNFDGYPVDGKLFCAENEAGAAFYAQQLAERGQTVLLRFPARFARKAADPYGNPGDVWTRDSIAPGNLETLTATGWLPLRAIPMAAATRAPPVLPAFKVAGLQVRICADGIHRAYADETVVLALVERDGCLLDAATPGVTGRETAVLELLERMSLPARGRAALVLGMHGLRSNEDGSWTLDTPPTFGMSRS
jgi:hypothetical protein